MSEAQTPKRVSRRTVAKGAAWTVPAVVVAAPAASAATSRKPIDFVGTGCKDPSGGPGARYFFELAIDASVGPASVAFTHTFSESAVFTHVAQRPLPFNEGVINIGAGVTSVLLKFNNPNNAANGLLTISYTLDGVDYDIDTDQYSADCQNRTPPIVPF